MMTYCNFYRFYSETHILYYSEFHSSYNSGMTHFVSKTTYPFLECFFSINEIFFTINSLQKVKIFYQSHKK